MIATGIGPPITAPRLVEFQAAVFSLQNLPRGGAIEDVDAAIRDVMSGDYKHIQAKYAQPLALIGSLLRTMICAPAGKTLLGADFTTIEPRILSLLADDQQKLDEFRTFDAGSGWDIYIATYARVFGVEPETVTKAGTRNRQDHGARPGIWRVS